MVRRSALIALLATIATGALAAGGASPAAAALPAVCTTGTPPLNIVVDRNAGRDRRRAISIENASGSSGSAIKPINLTISRNGQTRTMQFNDLNGEYRYTAKPGEKAGFVLTYVEDRSGYGPVTSPQSIDPRLDIPGLTNTVTGLLGQIGIPVDQLVPGLVNLLIPRTSGPAGFNGGACLRTQAAGVVESASASAKRSARAAKVRRINAPGGRVRH